MPDRLSTLLANIEGDLRAAWRNEGSPASFDEWKTERRARERADEEARMQAEIHAERRSRLLERLDTQIPPRYRSARVTDPRIASWCDTTHEGRGESLLILGPVGVGKSYEAFGAMRHLVGRHVRNAVVVVAADLYAALRPRAGIDAEAEFERYAHAPLLLVDDIGAAKASEWTEEINYRLVHHRYCHELPTVFTSNTPPRELGTVVGQRVASRLTEMCTVVVLDGQDRRRAA